MKSLVIGHLYGKLMNTYGDDGNIIALKKRCEWRGIKVEVKEIGIKDKIKKGECDLYFFGGGQDQSQQDVSTDLLTSSKKELILEIERGVPLLAICGGYQLLGKYYKPQIGPKMAGLGIFPIYTIGSDFRMIGNLAIDTEEFGKLVGFENHSGKTFLEKSAHELGKVIFGYGNNGEDQTEGCIYKNAIGCYMHGSLLPKNPILADFLIQKALEIKYGEKIELEKLNDFLEEEAHKNALEKKS